MNQKQIISRLKEILSRSDTQSDGPVNRKRSDDHDGEIQILLEHLSLLVTYLKFDLEATRRELFEVRKTLEE